MYLRVYHHGINLPLDQLYEGYIVYGLNLMKAILKCEDYMIPLMRGLADGTMS